MPDAVDAMKQSYVDGYLDCADTEMAAISRIRQVIDINRRGGFEMHKWACNREAVLRAIPGASDAANPMRVGLDNSSSSVTKVFGLTWDSRSDTLRFGASLSRINKNVINGSRRPTKREVLSAVMYVFDPLGFLSPFTIRGRILLQRIWRRGTNWDEVFGKSEFERWAKWLEALADLKNCEIPRCYLGRSSRVLSNELHIFIDASSEAYAAAVYGRVRFENEVMEVSFVTGKSRVALVKPVTIPRLELEAALVAARLARSVQDELQIFVDRRRFYTDSRMVFAWIRNDPRNFRAFVCFRLGEIGELSDPGEWGWVPTADNPADDSTRDTPANDSTRDTPANLNQESRWLRGPTFLHQTETVDQASESGNYEGAEEEIERTFTCREQKPAISESLSDISRFQSTTRLIYATARILQFVSILRRQLPRNSPITPELMERAEDRWLLCAQFESFSGEMECLRRGQSLDRKSKILKFTPLLSEDGLLRAQGRIDRPRVYRCLQSDRFYWTVAIH